MTFRMSHFVAIAITAGLATGCALVGLEPDAEGVRVVEEANAMGCEELGKTRVKVLGKIGFVARRNRLIEEELDTLARNAGADLAGNAVVADGPIEDGARAYRILRCPSINEEQQ